MEMGSEYLKNSDHYHINLGKWTIQNGLLGLDCIKGTRAALS
jgi:hypothetical protein